MTNGISLLHTKNVSSIQIKCDVDQCKIVHQVCMSLQKITTVWLCSNIIGTDNK